MNYCYVNGTILPETEAHISVRDIGLLRGYGIYDGLRTYNGKPFLFAEHFARFISSAEALGLVIPVTETELQQVITELVAKNGDTEAAIRIIITGGETSDGVTFNPATPTILVLTEPLPEYPKRIYREGVKLITYEYEREMPEIKTTNYITAVKLQPYQEQQSAFEVLYVSQGHILEATTSNFFLFLNDTLVTPKRNVLGGITRNLVLKLAKDSFSIEERELTVSELVGASEAFITSSFKEIVPVVKIDKTIIGQSIVGKRTKSLMDKFHKFTRRY